MNSLKNEKGYTLVEVLVALTLVMLLVFLTFQVLTTLLLNNNEKRLSAINLVQNQMNESLMSKKFQAFEKDLGHNLILKQVVEEKEGLKLIRVSIISHKNNKTIYRLSAYVRTD